MDMKKFGSGFKKSCRTLFVWSASQGCVGLNVLHRSDRWGMADKMHAREPGELEERLRDPNSIHLHVKRGRLAGVVHQQLLVLLQYYQSHHKFAPMKTRFQAHENQLREFNE